MKRFSTQDFNTPMLTFSDLLIIDKHKSLFNINIYCQNVSTLSPIFNIFICYDYSSSSAYLISNVDDHPNNVHSVSCNGKKLMIYSEIMFSDFELWYSYFSLQNGLKYRISTLIYHVLFQILKVSNFNVVNELGVFVHSSENFDVCNSISPRYLQHSFLQP